MQSIPWINSIHDHILLLVLTLQTRRRCGRAELGWVWWL